MGVLNLTPDSFSDGGKFKKKNLGYKHAVYLFKLGANIIDVGGESTRPGSREIFEVLDDNSYQALKGDYYRRLLANTDDDVKTFAKRVIENKQDVKLERLTKDQRKDMLIMITDRIKMGNRKFMKEYDPKFPVDEDFASGGRVPLDGGGSTVDLDWDDMDIDEWLHLIKLARAGEFGGAEGGRVPYWKGGSCKMIKEAIKHNKIFGLGGPPYKPGATSFDIIQLTKDRFGTELSLKDLKEI